MCLCVEMKGYPWTSATRVRPTQLHTENRIEMKKKRERKKIAELAHTPNVTVLCLCLNLVFSIILLWFFFSFHLQMPHIVWNLIWMLATAAIWTNMHCWIEQFNIYSGRSENNLIPFCSAQSYRNSCWCARLGERKNRQQQIDRHHHRHHCRAVQMAWTESNVCWWSQLFWALGHGLCWFVTVAHARIFGVHTSRK